MARSRYTNYVDDIRFKTMDVLSTIFEGDMINVWAAYIAIFPNQKGDIDEDALDTVLELSRDLYK